MFALVPDQMALYILMAGYSCALNYLAFIRAEAVFELLLLPIEISSVSSSKFKELIAPFDE